VTHRQTQKQNRFLGRQNFIIFGILLLSIVVNAAMVASTIYAFKDTEAQDGNLVDVETGKPVATSSVIEEFGPEIVGFSPMELSKIQYLRLDLENGNGFTVFKVTNRLRYTRNNGSGETRVLFEVEPSWLSPLQGPQGEEIPVAAVVMGTNGPELLDSTALRAEVAAAHGNSHNQTNRSLQSGNEAQGPARGLSMDNGYSAWGAR